jgi:hypothetical protein
MLGEPWNESHSAPTNARHSHQSRTSPAPHGSGCNPGRYAQHGGVTSHDGLPPPVPRMQTHAAPAGSESEQSHVEPASASFGSIGRQYPCPKS